MIINASHLERVRLARIAAGLSVWYAGWPRPAPRVIWAHREIPHDVYVREERRRVNQQSSVWNALFERRFASVRRSQDAERPEEARPTRSRGHLEVLQ
jgi:hypothetical protein